MIAYGAWFLGGILVGCGLVYALNRISKDFDQFDDIYRDRHSV